MKDGKHRKHKLMPTPKHDRLQACLLSFCLALSGSHSFCGQTFTMVFFRTKSTYCYKIYILIRFCVLMQKIRMEGKAYNFPKNS